MIIGEDTKVTMIQDWRDHKPLKVNPFAEALKWLFSILGIFVVMLVLFNSETLVMFIRAVV